MLQDTSHHANRILTQVQGGLRDQEGDVVAQSWSRCVNEYSLNPDAPRAPKFIEGSDLEARRMRLADLIACARHEMTILYQQLGDIESAVVLTDTDGVIVHMVSSPKFSAEAGPLGLRLGGIWSEETAGTNGMGTCLAEAGPVWVHREDHFFHQLAQLTCSAVPVYDPSGEITAVLDVSSRSSVMQQHLLVMLGMTARMIENRLIDRCFSKAHPLHFHSRPEFVFTLHEGKLAVNAEGQVLAANRSALFQLGMTSMKDIRSRRVEDLFATSLDDMLERSTLSSFHPVVTYHANANLRFFAVAQRPAQPSGSPSSTSLVPSPPAPAAMRNDTVGTAVRARISPAAPRPRDDTFKDARLLEHLHTASRVIARQTPVLLCGETGAGKEVFARAVHGSSPYASGAFVAINCACLPESLIESELFGYRAGAFTGAQRGGRRGKIMQADRGTLFLDEIADMPLELQARLLRVLDERQVTPLGSEDIHPVDFQLISASHQHLPTLVREHRFREDLYYRLAGIELLIPSLRDRSDKPELIRDILAAEGGSGAVLLPEAEHALMEYPWPGNVRQLRHVLRTALALADGRPITRAHLTALPVDPLSPMPPTRFSRLASPAPSPAQSHNASTADPYDPDTADAAAFEALLRDAAMPGKLNPLQAHERAMLIQLIVQHRWNVSNVAKTLSISRNALYRKLHKLDIEVSHPGKVSHL
jgi:sigma-54 dependent transcriptional regulator, acetoin dehydrogenase operon transcriptional activator AcoR